MKRLGALIVALLVSWLTLGSPASAAVEPPTGHLAFSYLTQHALSAGTSNQVERGPPASYDSLISRDADGRWSGGASARIEVRATYGYDRPEDFAPVARKTGITEAGARVSKGRPVVLERAGVAADTVVVGRSVPPR